MIIESMPVRDIAIDERKRSLDATKVDDLVISIRKLGLRTPITVRVVSERVDDNGITCFEVPILVAGRHRLEAARILGWDEIPAVVSDGTETDARLWEIAENLHRADLTVLERSEHIAEWIKLSEEKELKPAQVDPVCARGGRGKTGGINAAARDLGIERKEAQRAVKINRMPDEVKKAAEDAGIDDNQSALLQVAAEPSAEAQLKAIKQKKDHDEAQKRNREAKKKKRRRTEIEEHRRKREEFEKANAECVRNAAKFLISKLGCSGVLELFRLLGDTHISELGQAFRDGDYSRGSPRLLTEKQIEEKFGHGGVA